jgi:hypothetical protein
MVTVYQAKIWDYLRDGLRVTQQKGTIAWASNRHGMILPDTAEEVPETCVDTEGCYRGATDRDADTEPAAEIIVFRARRHG